METEEDIKYVEKEYPPYISKTLEKEYSHISIELRKFLKDNYGIDSIQDAIFRNEDDFFSFVRFIQHLLRFISGNMAILHMRRQRTSSQNFMTGKAVLSIGTSLLKDMPG